MVAQATGFVFAPHSPGYVYDAQKTRILSAHNATNQNIVAGMPIALATTNSRAPNPDVVPWTGLSQALLGWAVSPAVVDYNDTDTTEYIRPGYPVPWVDAGIISVVSETAFTAAQFGAVFIRHTAAAAPNNIVGRIRNAAVAGQTATLPAIVLDYQLYNGLHIVKLRLSRVAALVANT